MNLNKIENQAFYQNAIKRFKEKGIILPTFSEMENPELIPEKIKNQLKNIGLWDINPLNLFRITWKNQAISHGGLFGKVNFIELPSTLSGVKARIFVLLGKWFPTGAHKVGAAYGCLVPRIVTGNFDPTYHKAVWPSTGNYCRGGAFDSKIMGCDSVAILPEEMSNERFVWLRDKIGCEVIATPGCESNVKEIYDKCWEIRRTREDCVILNQFDEFGNASWHFNITGKAIEEIYTNNCKSANNFSAFISSTGSAGTIAAGDYLKTKFPAMKTVASEALQCPTLLMNGFGGHRIEGIGDKHVPWIHNVKNTDLVAAIDDESCMKILRLFNENEGKKVLIENGLEENFVERLAEIGISGIANILAAIKVAKYFEMNSEDVIFTIATDSSEMYRSRFDEMNSIHGNYTTLKAAVDFESCIKAETYNNLKELNYNDKKAIHNLKYFTWIEQQAKNIEYLNRLWYDKTFWHNEFNVAEKLDELITEFNNQTGLLSKL